MKNKYKIAGIGTFVCAALYILSYILCYSLVESTADLEYAFSWTFVLSFVGGLVFVELFPPLAFLLFIPLILMTVLMASFAKVYLFFILLAVMIGVGLVTFFKRKIKLGTKILMGIGIGLKIGVVCMNGFFALSAFWEAELAAFGIALLSISLLILLSIVLDICAMIKKKRHKSSSR